ADPSQVRVRGQAIPGISTSRRIFKYSALLRPPRSPTLELGVPRPALLEEGSDRVLQVLGREQLTGFGADRLVGGGDATFAGGAQDVAGHRRGPWRARRQARRE